MSEGEERGRGPRRTRVVLIGLVTLACGLALFAQFFPVYYVYNEESPSTLASDFLRRLHARQVAHFEAQGRYLGEAAWSEWPEGAFPGPEGVPWGSPTQSPWVELRERPHGPLSFKVRVRTGQGPEDAEEGLFVNPPEGPWFVLQARADLDGDGVIWLIEMNSLSPHLYIENHDE